MNILLAASEAVPFCKTGGLADVAGALAVKMGEAGHRVLLSLPKYKCIAPNFLEGVRRVSFEIPLGSSRRTMTAAWKTTGPIDVCFIEDAPFFEREGIYVEKGEAYPDNDERFIALSRGVLGAAKAIDFKPDIIHVHDWQTALITAYLGKFHRDDPFFKGAGSVLTLHNMAYQGVFPKETLSLAGFGLEELALDRYEFHKQFSFLKAGILEADYLTTVSPTYASEICESEELGCGLDGVLSMRRESLTGILNGLDMDIWDPGKDPHIPHRFTARDFKTGKAACKREVRKQCGFKTDSRLPLICIVSRLDYQKGLDLALEVLESRLDRCQLAILGDGDREISEGFSDLARRRPDSVFFHHGYDEVLAHRLYSAGDILLMPSRFEPCGLTQMIAMRYGGLPVASRVGGLCDTVFETASDGRNANGYLADPEDEKGLGEALDRALALFGTPEWEGRVREAMAGDYSWDKSVRDYLGVYEKARKVAAATR